MVRSGQAIYVVNPTIPAPPPLTPIPKNYVDSNPTQLDLELVHTPKQTEEDDSESEEKDPLNYHVGQDMKGILRLFLERLYGNILLLFSLLYSGKLHVRKYILFSFDTFLPQI